MGFIEQVQAANHYKASSGATVEGARCIKKTFLECSVLHFVFSLYILPYRMYTYLKCNLRNCFTLS